MPRPRVVVHNSVSVDGAVAGFDVDMGRHYAVASDVATDIRLVGSTTARTGLETFGLPDERPEDRRRPDKPSTLPWWAIIDSGGRLEGMLHGFRSFEGCRDVIVLTSSAAPASYVDYLNSRDYRWHACGDRRVDLQRALDELGETYGARTVMTDTGPALVGALLEAGLVGEISLLTHPVVAGENQPKLFGAVSGPVALRALGQPEAGDDGLIATRYAVASADERPADKEGN